MQRKGCDVGEVSWWRALILVTETSSEMVKRRARSLKKWELRQHLKKNICRSSKSTWDGSRETYAGITADAQVMYWLCPSGLAAETLSTGLLVRHCSLNVSRLGLQVWLPSGCEGQKQSVPTHPLSAALPPA